MCIKDRIERLRQKMEEHHISVYMIPTADYHQSEYVGEHFKSRAFITGFTGSAGTAVITKEESCLWTDGRYFLQAESQLRGKRDPSAEDGRTGSAYDRRIYRICTGRI